MKLNKWTVGLAAVGVVSLASAARADEKMSQIQTELSNTTISGYISSSFNWAISPGDNSPAKSLLGGIPYQGINKQNGFNLDVVDLSIAKPQDESPWASGYQVDLLFGPDAATFGASSSYFAIEQAYIALRTPVGNGIDWKVGVFNSPIGYESFDAGLNPNYTRSWGYAVEPTTFTGVLASYKITDQWAISAGIANTANNVINGRAYNHVTAGVYDQAKDWNKTFMGSVAYTAPSSWGSLAGSTIDAGVIYGFNGQRTNSVTGPNGGSYYANGDQINYYAGATLNTPWAPLKVGAALDYVHNLDDGLLSPLATDRELNAFVLGLYGTYKATDKLNLNARVEYINLEAEGAATTTNLRNTTDGFGVTATVDYAMWANVLSRLELRWDHFGNKNADALTSAALAKTDSIGFYANLIYKF